MLTVDIDLTGAPFSDSTYYISNEASTFKGGVNYQPFLAELPDFQVGDFDVGWAEPKVGQIRLDNRKDDSLHPFSGENYVSLISNPATAIPITMRWQGSPVFQGSMICQSLNED